MINGTGYVKRSEYMSLADVAEAGAANPEWELLGDRVEEMAIEMNPNVESGEDVTGKSWAMLDKYEPSTSVEPFRARRDSKMFDIVYNIVRYNKTLDDVERDFCHVNVFDKNESGQCAAWTQRGIIAVQSYGGDTTGLSAPFEVHWAGEKTHGWFDVKTKTFVPEENAG